MQKLIHQRGFSVVNVGNNGNVPDLTYFHNSSKFTF